MEYTSLAWPDLISEQVHAYNPQSISTLRQNRIWPRETRNALPQSIVELDDLNRFKNQLTSPLFHRLNVH